MRHSNREAAASPSQATAQSGSTRTASCRSSRPRCQFFKGTQLLAAQVELVAVAALITLDARPVRGLRAGRRQDCVDDRLRDAALQAGTRAYVAFVIRLPHGVAGRQADQARVHLEPACVKAHLARQEGGHAEFRRDGLAAGSGRLNHAARLGTEHLQPGDPAELLPQFTRDGLADRLVLVRNPDIVERHHDERPLLGRLRRARVRRRAAQHVDVEDDDGEDAREQRVVAEVRNGAAVTVLQRRRAPYALPRDIEEPGDNQHEREADRHRHQQVAHRGRGQAGPGQDLDDLQRNPAAQNVKRHRVQDLAALEFRKQLHFSMNSRR